MTQHEHKQFGGFEVKDEARGTVEAIVASLGVVDHDRDVIMPSAIQDGAKVKLSFYGHDALFGSAPVGAGKVHIVGNKAVLKGQFFMTTQRGREAFETVKAIGADGEWSTGFVIKKLGDLTDAWRAKGAERIIAEMDLFEASPVIRGASPSTRTLAVKSQSDQADLRATVKAHEQRELRMIEENFRAVLLPQAAAAAKAQELRELRLIGHKLQFEPERADHLVPLLLYKRLKDLAHLACTYLTRGPVEVRYYERASWQKHRGFFRSVEPNVVWVALGDEKEMALTLVHEIAHAAGYPSEEVAERNAETIVALWESLLTAA